VQVSHDTSLFANETSYPVIEAQARHVENLLLKLVMLSDEGKAARADSFSGSGTYVPCLSLSQVVDFRVFSFSGFPARGFGSFGARQRWRLVAFWHAEARRFERRTWHKQQAGTDWAPVKESSNAHGIRRPEQLVLLKLEVGPSPRATESAASACILAPPVLVARMCPSTLRLGSLAQSLSGSGRDTDTGRTTGQEHVLFAPRFCFYW
jgi:hypothetical protein